MWERRAGERDFALVAEREDEDVVVVVVAVDWVEVRFREEEREGGLDGSVDRDSAFVASVLFNVREVFEGGGEGGVIGCQMSVSTSNIQMSLKHSPPSLPPNIISLLPTMFAVW